jgi:hypothetical protein
LQSLFIDVNKAFSAPSNNIHIYKNQKCDHRKVYYLVGFSNHFIENLVLDLFLSSARFKLGMEFEIESTFPWDNRIHLLKGCFLHEMCHSEPSCKNRLFLVNLTK